MQNAPFLDQRQNGGFSNSPFTDERRGGGGGGGGSDGNVNYNINNDTLSSRTNNVDTIIETIDQGINFFKLGNDVGNIEFDKDNDILELSSNEEMLIDADGDMNVISLNSNVTIQTQTQSIELKENSNEIEINTTGNVDIKSSNEGNNFSVTKVDSQGVPESQFLVVSNATETTVAGSNVTKYQFASTPGNNDIKPVYRFSDTTQSGSGFDWVQYDNSPQNINDVLTFVSGGGSTTNPKVLEWKQPTSTGGDVGYDSNKSLTFDDNGVTSVIQEIQFSTSGNGDDSIKFEQSGTGRRISMNSEGDAFNECLLRAFNDPAPPNTVDQRASITCRTNASAGGNFINQFVSGDSTPGTGVFNWSTFDNETCVNTSNSMGMSVIPGDTTGTPGSSDPKDSVKFSNVQTYRFSSKAGTGASTDLSSPLFGFNYDSALSGSPQPYERELYYQFEGKPSAGAKVLTVNQSGNPTGDATDPFKITFQSPGSGGGNANANLVLSYDAGSSALTLSDPVDGLTNISSAVVVPGRTIFVGPSLTFTNINVDNSVMFLDAGTGNSGPSASSRIVGNNPPSVPLDANGNTQWFPGATFRTTCSGKIIDFDGNDNLIFKFWANRGQNTQDLLANHNLELLQVAQNNIYGWIWTTTFTCRSVNVGGTLGTASIATQFQYSDDNFQPNQEGGNYSSQIANFDTSVPQFLDQTLRFNAAGNSIRVDNVIIERIF